jgi:Zn-dependent protease/CBS domain-containing protein
MRWSWRVARIAGIDIDIHATFAILLAWIALADYRRAGSGAAVESVLFTLAIFVSVLLHEYGHALTAARFGVKTRRITLLPIGGVASLERIPDRPRQELAVALAGPAVTLGVAGALYIALRLAGAPTTPPPAAATGSSAFVAGLMWINIALLLFNLLPAFPMDGGRVLRAAIAMRTDHARATDIAARVGKAFAFVFGLVGLFVVNNPFLVVIALFVWISAAGEAAAAQFKATVGDLPVAHAMIANVKTLAPSDSVSVAVDAVRTGFQHDFPVMEDHSVAGVLTREALLKALADGRGDVPVRDVMQRNFASTTPDEPLERAMARLQGCHCHTLPVLRDHELVGILTAEKVGELVMIESAARAGHDHDRRPVA